MKYSEVGFRAFYKKFCVMMPKPKTADAMRDHFPDIEKSNSVLGYGYYDRDAGMTLDIFAAADVNGKSANVKATAEQVRLMIRIGEETEDDFLFFNDKDGVFAQRYAEKLKC